MRPTHAPQAPDFDPVPVRARRDGWTEPRQREFVAMLAIGWRPGHAASRLGMSRKSAYALRARRGGESFAAAWDAAIAAARRRRADARGPGEWQRAVEGVLHPVRYRGRIVAWERRFDNAAFIRLLGRVDRLIEKNEIAGRSISPYG
jgi:hypothetical protein